MFDLNFHYELNQRIIALTTPFQNIYSNIQQKNQLKKTTVSLQQKMKYNDTNQSIYNNLEYGRYIQDVLKYFDLFDDMMKIYNSRMNCYDTYITNEKT